MAQSEATKKAPPPYVSYKTFTNFLAGLKADGIPPVIDTSTMRHLSGAVAAQLKSTLRYLGLVEQVGQDLRPLPMLEKLVYAEGAERKEALHSVVEASYPFLLGDQAGDFDLARATADQFTRKFRELGIDGDTVRKAEGFFLNIAEPAGVQVSKRIKMGRTSGTKKASKGHSQSSSQTTAQAPRSASSDTRSDNGDSEERQQRSLERPSAPARPIDVVLQGVQTMATKFPDFDPTWDAAVQDSWFKAWERMSGQLMSMSEQIVEVTRLQLEAELGMDTDEGESQY